MNAQEILRYLEELGEELARRRAPTPTRIMLIGGAVMLNLIGNRDSTEDIDYFPLDIPNPKDFARAARTIHRQHRLPRNWINDVASTILGEIGPAPTPQLWRTTGNGALEIYIPPLDFILALKTFADRPKDLNDIAALLSTLNITSRTQLQAILNRYIYLRYQIEYRSTASIARITRDFHLRE
jgi:hypothetical protein